VNTVPYIICYWRGWADRKFSVLRVHAQYVYFHWCGLHEKHEISFGILTQTKNFPQDAVKSLAILVVDHTVQCLSTEGASPDGTAKLFQNSLLNVLIILLKLF
jgi:hypothetical protein